MIPTNRKARFFPLALTALMCGVGNPALAHDVFVHRTLTEEALAEMGWTDPEAIDRVATYNVGTDIGRLPGHSRAALQFVFPGAAGETPEIRRLTATAPFNPETTVGFHFNSLYSFESIFTRWNELDEWVFMQCEYIAANPADQARYYQVLGITLHAVQDFYAHANWVGLLDRYTVDSLDPAEFPVWEELIENDAGWREAHPALPYDEAINRLKASNAFMSGEETLGGLQTGRIRGEDVDGDITPWIHRHERGEARGVAHDLARRATRLWVERIDRNIAGARSRLQADLRTSASPAAVSTD